MHMLRRAPDCWKTFWASHRTSCSSTSHSVELFKWALRGTPRKSRSAANTTVGQLWPRMTRRTFRSSSSIRLNQAWPVISLIKSTTKVTWWYCYLVDTSRSPLFFQPDLLEQNNVDADTTTVLVAHGADTGVDVRDNQRRAKAKLQGGFVVGSTTKVTRN